MKLINEMKDLILKLNEASTAYYKYDNPIMNDKNYDELYDRLAYLEKESGVILSNSPTQKVQGEILEGLTKVKHSKPMLSAQKTKDVGEIKNFCKVNKTYASFKLDGLTIVVKYANGKLTQALTRGSGDYGEDVTAQAKMIINLPLEIPFKEYLELRGECVISWKNFKKINESLEVPYSHPRNLAAGSIRQLNTDIVKERHLEFVVFEVVNAKGGDSKFIQLKSMDNLGFTTVERTYIDEQNTVANVVNKMIPDTYKYPVDGLIFEYDDINYSRSLGATSHHELCRIALKWKDEIVQTRTKYIDWTMGKTGVLTPTMVFEPCEIDGTIVERASLHNVGILKNMNPTKGCIANVYKANMIIPQVESFENSLDDNYPIPTKCPICGEATKIVKENDTEVLVCTNDNCRGKLLGKLSHFVSKHALNIEGLSEETLKKFIELGLTTPTDIFYLPTRKEIKNIPGFGEKSFNKMCAAIEKSKITTLDRVLYSLSIPLVGRDVSKRISQKCKGDINIFKDLIADDYSWDKIEGIGETINNSIYNYFNNFKNLHSFMYLLDKLEIIPENDEESNESLKGLTFVITGSVNHYKNRDELKADIEARNGKVAGSVSKSTSYLINNDSTSTSGKNKKAQELGVKIITEDEFLKMTK